tara:strand:- start:1761 stop:2033 length:273 start_codon:yes stop_codon:yes gene_type:complete
MHGINLKMQNLIQFKVPVPNAIPDDAKKDSLGRSWKKQEKGYYSWDGDFWNVWFRRNKKPEVGEMIFDMKIKKVYVYRNYKRGVVEFESI